MIHLVYCQSGATGFLELFDIQGRRSNSRVSHSQSNRMARRRFSMVFVGKVYGVPACRCKSVQQAAAHADVVTWRLDDSQGL